MSAMPPFDPNRVTASVITDIITRTFRAVGESVTGRLKLAYDQIFEDFAPTITSTYNRISRFRIICKRDEDVLFDDIYTSTSFKSNEDSFTDREVVEFLSDGSNIAIVGIGGAGKTLFMRYCWLTIFRYNSNKIPIYYELRNLNGLTSIDLLTSIKLELSREKVVSDDLLACLCNDGRFIFLLDGFDEIKRELRDTVEAQIHSIRIQYPKCNIVVSSRNDLRFSGWQGFRVFESRPLEIGQTKELLRKVPFDNNYKSAFLKKIDDAFFARNRSFLSTPLLAIIMMMTFRDNVDTPSKMSIFYQQAFLTLYQMHDATKMYSRQKCLDINDFQEVLSIFCLLTYTAEKFSLSDDDALRYVSMSLEAARKSSNPGQFLSDLIESVNIMKREGFDISFIHRSFQEYFCASALIKLFPTKLYDFTKSFSSRASDNVLSLAYEMNRHLFVTEVIARRANELDFLFDAMKQKTKYRILSAICAKYSFRVKIENRRKLKYVSRVGGLRGTSSSASEFFSLLHTVIIQRNPSSLPPVIRAAAECGVFDIFRGKQDYSPDIDVYSFINFSFSGDDIMLSGDLDGLSEPVKFPRTDVKGIITGRAVETFDRTEKYLENLVSDTQKWVLKEVNSANRQTKFLEDLLK